MNPKILQQIAKESGMSEAEVNRKMDALMATMHTAAQYTPTPEDGARLLLAATALIVGMIAQTTCEHDECKRIAGQLKDALSTCNAQMQAALAQVSKSKARGMGLPDAFPSGGSDSIN